MSLFIITVALFLLIYISFLIKIPKVTIPLGTIYLLFLINYLINGLNNLEKENVSNFSDLEDIPEKKSTVIENNMKKSNVEPRPLVITNIEENKKEDKSKTSLRKPEKKEPVEKVPLKPYVTTLTMRDMQICRNVKNRNPIGTDTYFENTVDSLFCYTRVQNTGGKQELTHIWFFENQKIGTVRYNIKTSNIYRSWTRKTILSHQVGTWRVEVQDTAGVIIGSEFFYITSPEN
ncbi:MAG: hypothetical protein CMP35_03310 [Rickettsiales bacterium]|nr:hypothetical protein [Rickettsiales bacterium]|tara:strand:- start:239 stop:937 length:699 start_codon:yes stop_codon:yes gene_type:complete